MIDRPKPAAPTAPGPVIPDSGALLLAAGGLAAAFGAASCCALPLLLASLGLGSAWLAALAWFVGPHRIALLAVSVACLAGGGALLLRRRRGGARSDNCCSARRTITAAVGASMLSLGAVLVALGFVFA